MSFTTNKNLETPARGSNVDVWDVPLNSDFDIIDLALGGVTSLNAGSGSVTLTNVQYQPLIISISGTLAANITYTIPSGVGGQWIVRNTATGGSYTVTFASGGAGDSVVIDRNISTLIFSDGTNVRFSDTRVRPALAAGSSTQIQFNTSGVLDASANFVYSGGNLGVGTASPSQPLEVAGTIYSTSGGFKFPDGSVQTSASSGAPSSYVSTISFGSTGLLPSTASTGVVTVAGTLAVANGGTGITAFGTGVATALGQNVTGSGSIALSASPTFTGTTTAATISATTVNATSVSTTGSISVGTTIDATGNITSQAAITAYSDVSLKRNVQKIEGALEMVKNLRGVSYEMINTGQQSVGVIAQEIQKVVPQVVHDNNGILSVSYGNIVAVLIEAIKELSIEIDKIKAKTPA